MKLQGIAIHENCKELGLSIVPGVKIEIIRFGDKQVFYHQPFHLDVKKFNSV